MDIPELKSQTLKCVDCDCAFIWTEGEQRYYLGRGLATPKRCQSCRLRRRETIDRGQRG